MHSNVLSYSKNKHCHAKMQPFYNLLLLQHEHEKYEVLAGRHDDVGFKTCNKCQHGRTTLLHVHWYTGSTTAAAEAQAQ